MALAVGQRILSLAVHLPEFVRSAALKALSRGTVVAFADQFMALQNPMDGSHRQTDLLLCQQHLQLLRAPAGLLTQCYHALLFRSFRQAWTVVRPATAFLQRTQTAPLYIAPAPE